MFESRDARISRLLYEEHGTEFFFFSFSFQVGTLQEILGYVGTRLADWSLYSVSAFSVFPFSHIVISSELSGRELL